MAETMFIVNGKEYPAPEEFTLGEMCDAEQLFGVDFSSPKGQTSKIAATLYIAIKRVDPTVTVEDIRALPPDAFDVKSDDASPPSVPLSDEKQIDSSGTSGDASELDGASPDSALNGTGQGRSATPATSGRTS